MLTHAHLLDLTTSRIPILWITGHPVLDMKLDCWLYKSRYPEDKTLAELVLTPISRQYWRDLWEITVTVVERPGMLAALSRFLGEKKINIVHASSTTCDDSRFHINRLVVDCILYKSALDGDSEMRTAKDETMLHDLRRELALEFIEYIHFRRRNSPSLFVERHQEFWQFYHASGPQQEVGLTVVDGSVKMTAEVLAQLPDAYSRSYGIPADQLVAPAGLLTAGSRLDLARISVIYPGLGIIETAITIRNRPGAIGVVAEILAENNFNILGFRAATSDGAGRTSLWLVVQDLAAKIPVASEEITRKVTELVEPNKKLRQFEPHVEKIESILS